MGGYDTMGLANVARVLFPAECCMHPAWRAVWVPTMAKSIVRRIAKARKKRPVGIFTFELVIFNRIVFGLGITKLSGPFLKDKLAHASATQLRARATANLLQFHLVPKSTVKDQRMIGIPPWLSRTSYSMQ